MLVSQVSGHDLDGPEKQPITVSVLDVRVSYLYALYTQSVGVETLTRSALQDAASVEQVHYGEMGLYIQYMAVTGF